MVTPLLKPEDKESLQAFVDRSTAETPYLRRAKILLLADNNKTQEAIAVEVDVPITRVRQMLRAYKREGLALFPNELLLQQLFSTDEEMAEAGRLILASLVDKAKSFEPDLATITSVTAVHETRKTIRRLRTACKLFEPFFENGLLNSYRRRFRKFMRRLARSRDNAVFLIKLNQYIEELPDSEALTLEEVVALRQLSSHWEEKQSAVDEKVRGYLSKGKYQMLLSEFGSFTQTRGLGVQVAADPLAPTKVSYVAPVFINEKVSAVRAYDAYLDHASLELLHALRIKLKELRFSLEFFQPVMGPSAAQAIETVKKLLIHLGDLNDARIHLKMMDEVVKEDLTEAVLLYRQAKEVELAELKDNFPQLWRELENPEWRKQVALALAVM
ncbi:MAG: CHAD domain-containing protein [Chloroflexota bacterium]|jgi:CHAD domain-containing protein